MKILSLLILQAAAAQPIDPQPLSDLHMRDIGCVAIIALVADQQRRGMAGFAVYDDVNESGALFAANVGQRVTNESGQLREVIAFAIQESAREQLPLLSAERSEDLSARMQTCLPIMQAQSAADEPMPTADDYRTCAAIMGILIDAEHANIPNKPLLFENLSWRYRGAKYGKSRNGSVFSRADILKEKSAIGDVSSDDKTIERCIKLGS